MNDFNNLSLNFKTRASLLVNHLTVDEKISQMLHFSPEISRLGIPAYTWWNEALHGVARAGTATVFPQSIGMAASFDTELVYECACVISDEVRAKHHEFLRRGDTGIYKGLTIWSPNINIFRDPRWGRGHETYGEDPCLTGRMGVSFIKGMQGDDDVYLKTVATAKHYAVHSGPEKLRHSFDAVVSPRDLYETYLPAFRDCVKEGMVYSVMGAYNRTNSEACCASPTLLQKILRDDWGFEGYVVSDCHAICDLHLYHHLTEHPHESAAMAVKNGCDLNCGRTYVRLKAAFDEELISEEEIDIAVSRLFEARMKLGMFDPPERVPYSSIPYSKNDCRAHRQKSYEAACSTMTLLKNNGVLPLSKDIKTIAVVGPNADDRDVLFANYKGIASETITLLDGIREAVPDADIYYSLGCHISKTELRDDETSLLSEAVSCAMAADAVIIATGINSRIEGEEADPRYPEFGGGDRTDIDLPGLQNKLIDLLYETGKPLITVNMSGSAVNLCNADEKCDAVMQAWYPGSLGGRAVAGALFGDYSPSGKLPVTFYKSIEQLPAFDDYEMHDRTYRFFNDTPLYPFGYGLSYSDFDISCEIDNTDKLAAGESLSINVNVTNKGPIDAREIIQIYIDPPKTGKKNPNPELRAFKPIFVDTGLTKEISFSIDARTMSVINDDGQRIVTPGNYTIYIGACQPDERTYDLTSKCSCELVFEITSEADLILEY